VFEQQPVLVAELTADDLDAGSGDIGSHAVRSPESPQSFVVQIELRACSGQVGCQG
jgi:hypothetical protein